MVACSQRKRDVTAQGVGRGLTQSSKTEGSWQACASSPGGAGAGRRAVATGTHNHQLVAAVGSHGLVGEGCAGSVLRVQDGRVGGRAGAISAQEGVAGLQWQAAGLEVVEGAGDSAAVAASAAGGALDQLLFGKADVLAGGNLRPGLEGADGGKGPARIALQIKPGEVKGKASQ